MTSTLTSLIDVLRLTPTLYKEDSAEGGRTHAAFAVYVRIPFTADKSNGILSMALNLGEVVREQVEVLINANAWPEDKEGKRHLAALGIPSTYASTFKELKAFLDVEHCVLYNLKALGAMVVFGNNDTSDGGPSSLTMRFGPIAFSRKLTGNYRELAATYWATSSFVKTMSPFSIINCVAHVERTDMLVQVHQSKPVTEMFGVEITKGQMEIEFTLIDRRTAMPVAERGSYGDS